MLCVKDNGSARWALRDYASLLLVMAVAVALRTAFHAGMLSPDDLTYVDRAVRILNGDWSVTTYVGGLRYGVNLPMALSMKILGRQRIRRESVATRLLGCRGRARLRRGAFYVWRSCCGAECARARALTCACTLCGPGHGGSSLGVSRHTCFRRIYARRKAEVRGALRARRAVMRRDHLGERNGHAADRNVITFLRAADPNVEIGVVVGNWGCRRRSSGEFCLLRLVAGDPLFVVKAMTGGVQTFMALTALATGSTLETSPFYYLWKLFVDIRHVWLHGIPCGRWTRHRVRVSELAFRRGRFSGSLHSLLGACAARDIFPRAGLITSVSTHLEAAKLPAHLRGAVLYPRWIRALTISIGLESRSRSHIRSAACC